MSTVRHLISAQQVAQYQALPGQPVTGAFLYQHSTVVMADAASSLESFLLNYEVMSVDIQSADRLLFAATIEYRRRVVTCDSCQRPFYGLPQWLFFSVGPARQYRWCSNACQSVLIAQAQAETEKRRQEIGDLVEAGWQYLKFRQAVPDDIRAYMTPDEWRALGKICSDEYTALHRQLVAVLVSRPSYTEPPVESQKPHYSYSTQSLWEEAAQ